MYWGCQALHPKHDVHTPARLLFVDYPSVLGLGLGLTFNHMFWLTECFLMLIFILILFVFFFFFFDWQTAEGSCGYLFLDRRLYGNWSSMLYPQNLLLNLLTTVSAVVMCSDGPASIRQSMSCLIHLFIPNIREIIREEIDRHGCRDEG